MEKLESRAIPEEWEREMERRQARVRKLMCELQQELKQTHWWDRGCARAICAVINAINLALVEMRYEK